MSTTRFGTLDFYDDHGALLKKALPDAKDLPDFIKTASSVSPEEHANQFALVMIDEDGQVLKKFATADAGNTWLSALYFGMTHDRLPPEAEKLAAANLLVACEAYQIDPPDALLNLCGDTPPEGNLVYLEKSAAPARKVVAMEKKASTMALPGKYPLDDAADVQKAQEYFVEHERVFTPKQRHTFAVKTAAAARAVGFKVEPAIEKHASEAYSPVLKGHLDARHHYLTEAGAPREQVLGLLKLAAVRQKMLPLEFAEALEAFDKSAGLDAVWDKAVSDPWYSTFGIDFGNGSDRAVSTLVKVAEDGIITILSDRLQELAESGVISEHFGAAVGTAFQKDPETIFASMPLPQKKLIVQLAQSE